MRFFRFCCCCCLFCFVFKFSLLLLASVCFSVWCECFQNIKPVAVGGVGGSQFKTIIPLATQPNVQQIQVPGSRFHYVRLVTATTASSTGQPSGPSTSSIQTGDLWTCFVSSANKYRQHLVIVLYQLVMVLIPQLNLWWSVQQRSGCLSQLSQHRPWNR